MPSSTQKMASSLDQTRNPRGERPKGLAARVGKERLSAARREEDLVVHVRIGKGVGDEELVARVGNGRRRQGELVARDGQGDGARRECSRALRRRRRRGESGRVRWRGASATRRTGRARWEGRR